MGAVKNHFHDEIVRDGYFAGLGRDPSDCEHCDGFGMCWNNADPTSCQWVECGACLDTRGHP